MHFSGSSSFAAAMLVALSAVAAALPTGEAPSFDVMSKTASPWPSSTEDNQPTTTTTAPREPEHWQAEALVPVLTTEASSITTVEKTDESVSVLHTATMNPTTPRTATKPTPSPEEADSASMAARDLKSSGPPPGWEWPKHYIGYSEARQAGKTPKEMEANHDWMSEWGPPWSRTWKPDRQIGGASVRNACPFNVHSNIVHAPRPGDKDKPEERYSVLAPNETLKHGFFKYPNIGISWKLWRDDEGNGGNTAPIQLEYTWNASLYRTWYDLSMIDAGEVMWLGEDDASKDSQGSQAGKVAIKHAFHKEGMTLVPYLEKGVSTDGNCLPVACVPGEEVCTAAYNTWDDWAQQHDCSEGVQLQLTLCG